MPRRLLLDSVPVRYLGQNQHNPNIPPDDIYDDEANQYYKTSGYERLERDSSNQDKNTPDDDLPF